MFRVLIEVGQPYRLVHFTCVVIDVYVLSLAHSNAWKHIQPACRKRKVICSVCHYLMTFARMADVYKGCQRLSSFSWQVTAIFSQLKRLITFST